VSPDPSIPEVTYELDGHVATLTVNRPEKMNAMTDAMYAAIGDALRAAESDREVRAMIVTGAGNLAFSAGHDLAELADRGEGLGWQPWRARRFDNGLECSKPLIAAINGYCLAGGLELALLCDIRIATPLAQFGAPEVKRGILHGYGALRLTEIVGTSNAMELLLTGDFIDAETALRTGLVSRVVPEAELVSTARSLADTVASNAPIAVRLIKELALRGRELPLADGLRLYQEYSRLASASDDAREGTRAFVEKRNAEFKGE
jgi:enoyl-CoA hydratase/carnithine racemase